MKRFFALLLCLLLPLCGGCGQKSSAAADIQEQYSRIAAAQMEAEVTFHMPQEAAALPCNVRIRRSSPPLPSPRRKRSRV